MKLAKIALLSFSLLGGAALIALTGCCIQNTKSSQSSSCRDKERRCKPRNCSDRRAGCDKMKCHRQGKCDSGECSKGKCRARRNCKESTEDSSGSSMQATPAADSTEAAADATASSGWGF